MLAQSRVHAHQLIRAGAPDEEKGEAQDCSGLARVLKARGFMLSRRTQPGGETEQHNQRFRNRNGRTWVILTLIVMMPDKNAQFSRRIRLRW